MKRWNVTLNFLRPILGSTQAKDNSLFKNYLKNKMMTGRTGMSADIAQSRLDEEIENLRKDPTYEEKIKELEDRGVTVLYRDVEGRPSIGDHQIRGFMKDAFAFVGKRDGLLKKAKSGEAYSTDEAYRKWIGERISFTKRFYPLDGDVTLNLYDRPIRGMTASGPRTGIAVSEIVEDPKPLTVEFLSEDSLTEETLRAVFDRGVFKGISQWSNAQWGSFTYTLEEEKK